MDDAQKTSVPLSVESAAELAFRRYEANLGFWKVVLGTMIVGLAGVLIPGAVSFYTAHFENIRKEMEIRISEQAAHQQYIKDFFSTAINQDIELRIRFADYFSKLSGANQEKLWEHYLVELKSQRDDTRKKINEMEVKLVSFKKLAPEHIDNAEFDQINRELTWAYAEIGYVPIERSAIVKQGDNGTLTKKQQLYAETTEIVRRLASMKNSIDENSSDYLRFWILYNKELIGIESPVFSQTMIAIGKVLKRLATVKAMPDDELKRLAEELTLVSQRELIVVQNPYAQYGIPGMSPYGGGLGGGWQPLFGSFNP